MRVLSVIARMNVGGPARLLTEQLTHLDESIEQYLAVGSIDDGEADWLDLRAPQLRADPRIVRVRSLGRPIAPRNDLAAERQLRALIRHLRPDIVHTHTAKAGLVGRLAARREGVPAIVHTFHGHVLHSYFHPALGHAVRATERGLALISDRLLAVGTRVRDELLAAGIGVAGQYTVLPPGIAPPEEIPAAIARTSLGIDQQAPVVAFVGRLSTVKRPDRFVAMAQRVAREHPQTVFLVAGGGSDAEVQSLQAAAGAIDLRLLGWIAEVDRVYAAADVVVLSSDNEGMPVSLIEAGMAGRACVATDVGSVAEVVLDGRTGRVVDKDPDALAAAVSELLTDPDRRERYARAARKHTHERFSVPQLLATTAQVYEEVLADAHRRR